MPCKPALRLHRRALTTDVISVRSASYWAAQLRQRHRGLRYADLWKGFGEFSREISAWASIFFAPALIGTVYGMNFDHMPELDWVIGYPRTARDCAVAGRPLPGCNGASGCNDGRPR
jgi:hypothetical protein